MQTLYLNRANIWLCPEVSACAGRQTWCMTSSSAGNGFSNTGRRTFLAFMQHLCSLNNVACPVAKAICSQICLCGSLQLPNGWKSVKSALLVCRRCAGYIGVLLQDACTQAHLLRV